MIRNNTNIFRCFIVVMICCLVIQGSFFTPVSTVNAQSKSSLISLTTGVSVTLYDAQVVRDEVGNLASFTLLFENNSNSTVNLIDYWAKIKGSNNKSYVTKLIGEDKDKKYVIPKTTTYLTFYAYVDEKEKLTDLNIELIKWDFNANNYERIIGSLKSSTNGFTDYKKAKEININKALMNILVSDYKMYTDNQNAHISLDMAIRNKANNLLDLNSLEFYLSDGKGILIELEKSSKEVSLRAQERKNIILTTAVEKSFANNNLSVIVMLKDEGAAINIPKATFILPKLSSTAINKANKETRYTINGVSIALTMNESSLSYTNKKSVVETKVTLENKGNNKVKLPDFEFYIKSSQGYLYPIVSVETEEFDLLPKIAKEITLQGEIPQDLKLETSEIVVFVKNNENSQNNYLGSYQISIGKSTQPEQTSSSSATYQNMLIEQVSLQRTPNGINDLLIAEFKVTNKGNKGQGKLDMTGLFELDGVKLSAESTTIMNLDRLVAVSPGQSYKIVAYTEIPYIQNADKIVFRMQEKAESGLKDIHSFEVSSMSNARLLASNQSYNIDTLGGRGDVIVLDSSVYSGKQNDLFVAKLKYTNKEKRAAVPTKLIGYIENSKEDIIDLEVKSYETRLLPDGQAIIYVSAVTPKNYEDKKINLYFGEAIAGTEELQKVLINPVYTQHLFKNVETDSDFSNLIFNQYEVSLYNFYGQLDSSDGGWTIDGVKLDFEYDLKIRDEAPAYSDVENIIIEFSDATTPSIVFSQSFSINTDEESSLQLGTRKSQSLSVKNNFAHLKNFTTYNVNVYTEYKGYKKLIASKELQFGTVN
ncbi:hypothetical protein ACFP56_19995 [Paenibacillus septentrionalis]|uniref:CARDB domain-containing protein n=1 Tax=Paenibacillus septentrionalis TaxID=429342 RepID=A0ABW1V820_9BACL